MSFNIASGGQNHQSESRILISPSLEFFHPTQKPLSLRACKPRSQILKLHMPCACAVPMKLAGGRWDPEALRSPPDTPRILYAGLPSLGGGGRHSRCYARGASWLVSLKSTWLAF